MKKTVSLLLILSLMGPAYGGNKAKINLEEPAIVRKEAKSTVLKFDRDSILKAKELGRLQKEQERLKEEEQKKEEQKESAIMNNDPSYSNDDLYILSHVIEGEAGSDSNTDEEQLLVANVVLNRVKSGRFPSSIKEVVFAPGQYACVDDGNYYRQPNIRIINNAKRILSGERVCPENVLYQSNSVQGNIYKKIGNTYFCY